MRLTVLQRHDDPGFHPLSAVFQAPGGTLGRSADNHLALPDNERGICRVQAALRISGDDCYLINLSGMGRVSVNGRAITRDQEVPLSPGDELAIGPYTLKAEDPSAPAMSAATGAAGAAALADPLADTDPLLAEPDPLLAEPDPLLESPLIEGADLAPPTTQAAQPLTAPATADRQAAGIDAAPAAVPITAPTATPPGAAPAGQASGHPREAAEAQMPGARATETPPPAAEAVPGTPELPGGYPDTDHTRFDAPFGDLEPAPAEAPPPSNPSDVFSDLFGPGTLPVGSVPDVSAHPFDLESAQTRNPEDPLRQLPRGDANVSGPPRDPLDLLGSPDADDTHNVFSDQTPSTLPSDDPLAPHRSDPVTDTLNAPRDRDQDGQAARDHLREVGGYLRPARVQPQDGSDHDPAPGRRK